MSVQAGIWNLDGRPVDQGFLGKLGAAIDQYGPDGGNSYIDGSLGIVFRAFHTTLESRSERQPYVSPQGLALTWDGRLDNRKELMRTLWADVASDRTDVALVMAAYEKWGTNCFSKLIGDWALSVWDPCEQVLVLARDFVGIRHLYYYPRHERLLWCTNLASLALLSGLGFRLNDEYIAGFLAMYPEAHQTPYREISAVPPGKFVRVGNYKITVHPYWAFSTTRRLRYKTDGEYEEHFRHVFRQAIRRRLRSDSPILAELSGGLDSTSVVCVADNIIAKGETQLPRLDTLSYYDLNEPQGGDWFFFNKVEEYRGKVGFHINTSKSAASFSLDCPNFMAIPGRIGGGQEMEVERSNILQTGGYRVVLSGIGGDECLGGIPDPRSQFADLILRFRLLELIKQLTAWSAVKRMPWIQLLIRTVPVLLPRTLGQYLLKDALIEPWVNLRFAKRNRLALRKLGPSKGFGFFMPTRRRFAQTVAIISQGMSSMTPRLSIEEPRYPFLDQSLLEFLISIPATQLLRPGERRSLMRRALFNFLPHDVLNRRTKGIAARCYLVAIADQWLGLEEIFRSAVCSRLGYVNPESFLQELTAARAGNAHHLVGVLKIISLELWLRNLARHGLLNSANGATVSIASEFAAQNA